MPDRKIDETPLNAIALSVHVEPGQIDQDGDLSDVIVVQAIYVDDAEIPGEEGRTIRFLNLALIDGLGGELLEKLTHHFGTTYLEEESF